MQAGCAPQACVLAVDIGTQSTRAALVDPAGTVVDVAGSPIDLFAPRAGWAEQDPHQWWQTTVANIAAVMARNPGARVAAVGVSAQMHSLVAADAGRPAAHLAVSHLERQALPGPGRPLRPQAGRRAAQPAGRQPAAARLGRVQDGVAA